MDEAKEPLTVERAKATIAELQTENAKLVARTADLETSLNQAWRERDYWQSRTAETPAKTWLAQVEKERDSFRERLTKLEGLGPWIEANRLAQLQWADESTARGDVNHAEQRLMFEARADALKQVGYELSSCAGKDCRIDPATTALRGLRDKLTIDDDPSGYFRGMIDAEIEALGKETA